MKLQREDLSAFRSDLRSWLQAHVPRGEFPQEERERFEFLRAWQRTLFEHGWAGIAWPREYGGGGLSPLHEFVYYEELAFAHAPQPVNQPGITLVAPILMRYGSEYLRERYLIRMLSAEDVWCQGFSEPEAGSDLASLTTSATLRGDAFVVDGHKIWISWASHSDYCAALCRTSEGVQQSHAGLSLLIIPLASPGVVVRPIRQATGEQLEFAEIFLDGVEVPKSHLIGGLGEGWKISMEILSIERSDHAYHDHARLQVATEELSDLVSSAEGSARSQGFEQESIHRRLADASVRCGLLRELNLAVAKRRNAGEDVGTVASVIQIYWSELMQSVGSLLIDIELGFGSVSQKAVRDYLQSRAASIASGTSEIQRNIVAERVLGLPREIVATPGGTGTTTHVR